MVAVPMVNLGTKVIVRLNLLIFECLGDYFWPNLRGSTIITDLNGKQK